MGYFEQTVWLACQQQAEATVESDGGLKVQAWPIYEADWKTRSSAPNGLLLNDPRVWSRQLCIRGRGSPSAMISASDAAKSSSRTRIVSSGKMPSEANIRAMMPRFRLKQTVIEIR